ncbi:hypothetical protein ACLKA7_014113 [Drosophila subpalustris]
MGTWMYLDGYNHKAHLLKLPANGVHIKLEVIAKGELDYRISDKSLAGKLQECIANASPPDVECCVWTGGWRQEIKTTPQHGYGTKSKTKTKSWYFELWPSFISRALHSANFAVGLKSFASFMSLPWPSDFPRPHELS